MLILLHIQNINMAGLSIAIRGVASSVGQLQCAGLLLMTKNKAIEAPRSPMVAWKETNTPCCHLMKILLHIQNTNMAGQSISIRGVTSSIGQLQSAELLVMTNDKAIEAPRSPMVAWKETKTPCYNLM